MPPPTAGSWDFTVTVRVTASPAATRDGIGEKTSVVCGACTSTAMLLLRPLALAYGEWPVNRPVNTRCAPSAMDGVKVHVRAVAEVQEMRCWLS